VGSAEASVVGLALWGIFAWLTLLLYWAAVGRGRATPLTGRLDGFIPLQMLSRRGPATPTVTRLPRWRGAGGGRNSRAQSMGRGLLPSRVFVVVTHSHGHGRRACRVCRLGSRVDHRFLSAIASLRTSERRRFPPDRSRVGASLARDLPARRHAAASKLDLSGPSRSDDAHPLVSRRFARGSAHAAGRRSPS